MFIAHIPAGYIVTKALQQRLGYQKYLWVGVLGSILPDFDMLYFYLVDNQQHLHHGYWTHIPFFWLCIAVVVYGGLHLSRRTVYLTAAHLFFAGIYLHLFLDTIVGKIEWLQPVSDVKIYFFSVPAVYDWWVWNFVWHWTFLFEVGIILFAAWLLYKECNR